MDSPQPESSGFSPDAPARPRVVIQDPHASDPQNPLYLYLLGAGIVAGVLLIGLIVSYVYQGGKYDGLQTQYQTAVSDLDAKKGELTALQSELTAAKQEASLVKGDQASLAGVLAATKQNLTDKMNELGQCQSALVLAKGEIVRLQNLEATKCDSLVNEVKNVCNDAIDRLFVNATTACKKAVDDAPNATGIEIKEEVEDKINLKLYKFTITP